MLLKILFIGVAFYFITSCYAQNTFEHGVELYQNRQYQTAIEVFKNSTNSKTSVEESVLFYNIGNCYSALSEYDSAIHYFNYALTSDTNNANILQARGICYYATKSYSRSITDLLKSIKVDSSNLNSYFYLFDAYFELDSLNKALDIAAKCVNFMGDNQEDINEVLYINGLINYNLGNFNRSIDFFNKLLELNPYEDHARELRGISYYYLHNYNNAMIDLLNVKKGYKNTPEYNYYLGACLIYKEEPDYNNAIRYLNKGVKKGGGAEAYYYRSILYKKTYDFNKALSDLLVASKLAPEEENIIYELAYVQYKTGDYNAAEESLDKLRLISNDSISIAILNYFIQYSRDESLKDCDTIKSLNPTQLLELRYIQNDDITIIKEMQNKCN